MLEWDGRPTIGAEDQSLAQRVAVGKVASRERLVDDHDLRSSGPVLRREIATTEQRRAQHLEIPWPDDVIEERHFLSGLRLVTLDVGPPREQVVAQRGKLAQTRRFDAGQSRPALHQLLVEDLPARLVITAEAEIERHYERPGRIEAGVNRLQSLQAAHAESRADQH